MNTWIPHMLWQFIAGVYPQGRAEYGLMKSCKSSECDVNIKDIFIYALQSKQSKHYKMHQE